MQDHIDRRKDESAREYYQRLLELRDRLRGDLETRLRAAKQDASVEASEVELKRRLKRDLAKLKGGDPK